MTDRETPTKAAVAEPAAASRSGRKSRRKGKTGERELVHLARDNGCPDAERDWKTPQLDGDIGGVPGAHIEGRFRERIDIVAWSHEVEDKARNGNIPIVAYRKSREPWRASLPFADLIRLIALAQAHETGVGWPE